MKSARSLTWLCLLALCACHRAPSANARVSPKSHRSAEHGPAVAPPAAKSAAEPATLPPCLHPGGTALEAARRAYDSGSFQVALACSSEAAAESPDDASAQSEHAAALTVLGDFADARLAYARALAVDPNNLDALLGAAHLYGVSLPSSRPRAELAETYAERGRKLARARKLPKLVGDFALLSAMALDDLGVPDRALERVEEALALRPKDSDARYERALALFELCRFSEARKAFRALVSDPDHRAAADYHLGLLFERAGEATKARSRFQEAARLDAQDFPLPVPLSRQAFHDAVARVVKGLPATARTDLKRIPLTVEDIPKDSDLLATKPPLAPTILGIFRGPPLGTRCLPVDGDPCRSITLYRLNLERAVDTKPQLVEQIRVTLLHELGHLHGEDDVQLAARGLE